MTRTRTTRLLAGVVALGIIAAACGDDDDDDASSATTAAATETTAGGATETTAAATDTTAAGGGALDTDLAGVCPDPMVIQTDWFPESEHGALYELVGDDYTVDTGSKVVKGSLIASGGVDTGIDIEVRTGGPAIGFAGPSTQMYTDSSITLGYTSTDGVLSWADAPLVAVVAPLEINPQMIMWDPETYPDVKTIADLGEQNITINVFGGGGFSEVFVAQGIWNKDQVDPSYDGSPARFIAEGNIAQQGFASAEPYNYKNVFEEYGRDVAYQLLNDAGYEIYSQTLGARPDDLETLAPCLTKFVPIVQQAAVDFINDPARANAIIIDAVAKYDDFWVYDQGLADYSVQTQKELGLVGNGPDDTLGNIDEARVQGVIDELRDAGLSVPDDLKASDTFTNEFIDPSIGL